MSRGAGNHNRFRRGKGLGLCSFLRFLGVGVGGGSCIPLEKTRDCAGVRSRCQGPALAGGGRQRWDDFIRKRLNPNFKPAEDQKFSQLVIGTELLRKAMLDFIEKDGSTLEMNDRAPPP